MTTSARLLARPYPARACRVVCLCGRSIGEFIKDAALALFVAVVAAGAAWLVWWVWNFSGATLRLAGV